MNPIDPHSFPPSLSLDALSSLTPPSPILGDLGVSCSSETIPILFDFDVVCAPEVLPITSSSCSLSTSLCAPDHRGSVGTFGPLKRRSGQSDAGSLSPLSPTFAENSVLSDLTPSVSANSPRVSAAVLEHAQAPQLLGSSQTTSISCTALSASLSPSPSSLSPSPSSLSPSPSITSCPSSPRLRRKFKFPIDCNGPTLPASKSWVPVLESPEDKAAPAATEIRPSLPNHHNLPRPPLLRQPPIQPSMHDHKAFSLPKNLSWLKDTIVELLVDQEGFRGSLLRFKLVGLPKQARGWDSTDGGGLALFRPVKRETFRFHWAPFDADLPVIRRLTVNGDESRDFLSRQASLSLKTNGVYTVQGSESSHLPPSCFESGDLGSAKLRWRYEYLVEDRFHESGRIVDGEKNLTPISFLCSPYLLHPSQARKMTLMSLHFFKKSAATKLVAEKLEPPTSSSRFGQTPPVKPVATNMWTLHRRVQSTYTEEPKTRKKAKSLRRTNLKERDENQELVPAGRRRRASSAGEDRRPTQSGVHPATLHDNRLTKHIVPRAQLAELFNAEPGEVRTPGLVHQLHSDFQGLRPAPRR